ncbi:endonuclease domain-containing protein [Streptomyces sp. NPDC004788]
MRPARRGEVAPGVRGPAGRAGWLATPLRCPWSRAAAQACGDRGPAGRTGDPRGHKHCPGAGRDHATASPHGLRGSCRKAPAAHVDHCHETGRVRGVVCFNCNSAIGKLGDDPDVLRRAIAYLEGNAWKQTR